MPRDIVKAKIVRPTASRTATGGKPTVNVPIPGSPGDGWDCRLFRVSEITVNRIEAAPATALKDTNRRISMIDLTAPVQINDLVQLTDGWIGKIIRIRPYTRTLQCDLEVGVEGTWE